jgi:hypothetical protein
VYNAHEFVGKADESHLFQPRGKNITQRIVSNFGYSSVNTNKNILIHLYLFLELIKKKFSDGDVDFLGGWLVAGPCFGVLAEFYNALCLSEKANLLFRNYFISPSSAMAVESHQ